MGAKLSNLVLGQILTRFESSGLIDLLHFVMRAGLVDQVVRITENYFDHDQALLIAKQNARMQKIPMTICAMPIFTSPVRVALIKTNIFILMCISDFAHRAKDSSTFADDAEAVQIHLSL